MRGQTCHNIEAEIRGADAKILLIGAHYDSVFGSPGANDNGTGVAATLALARRFATAKPKRSLRFVAFVNEEPPYFLSGEMGSLVYARRCKERGDKISAMISLETIGYFSDAAHSQTYPSPGLGLFYPKVGNFIGFVSNVQSRALLRRVIALFRKHAKIPSEGAALPAFIPGVSWSDQWSFWRHGYPAIMVTDTAPFRYPHYHSSSDTPDKLDYDRFTLVVSGMEKVIENLSGF
jgi:Zn-dependent M28 family amino/carboxypeptidase